MKGDKEAIEDELEAELVEISSNVNMLTLRHVTIPVTSFHLGVGNIAPKKKPI